jgi:hypothetical protein
MGSRIDREALDRNVIVLLRWKNIRIRVNNIVLPLFQNVTLFKKANLPFLRVTFQNGDYKRTVEYMLITCNNCTVIGQKTIYSCIQRT